MSDLASPDLPPSNGGSWNPPTVEDLQPFFPKLVIERFLTAGGMSALYLARQPLMDRRVVLKVLPAELGTDLELSQRFIKEAQILGKLRDPGIVEIFDTGMTEGGHLYLLLEYEEGGDLRQWAEAASLSLAEVVEIGMSLCSPLAAAHAEGIVHGDIKPDNVFIDHKGRLKIGDFGLAEAAGSGRAKFHTPGYTAPELVKGESPSPASDIYAVGAMLYELACRETPPSHDFRRTEVLEALPTAFRDAIAAALSAHRAERPTAEVLRQKLTEARELLNRGAATQTSAPASGRPRPAPPARGSRNPVAPPTTRKGKSPLGWGAIATAVALLGGSVFFMESRKKAHSPDPMAGSATGGNGAPPGHNHTMANGEPRFPSGDGPEGAAPASAPTEAEAKAFADALADGKVDPAAASQPQAATQEEIAQWMPDWKVESKMSGVDGARFSSQQDNGHRVLVLHPFSPTRPWKMTRSVALPDDQPQQLFTRVGPLWRQTCDWVLKAFADDEPLGPPQVISVKTGRFRSIAWDLSPWKGKTVTLRLEGWAGGEYPWQWENGYVSEVAIQLLVDPAALRMTPPSPPTQAALDSSWKAVPPDTLPAEVRETIAKLGTFTQERKARARQELRTSRTKLITRLRPSAGAEAERIQSLPIDSDLMDDRSTAAAIHPRFNFMAGEWQSPNGTLTLKANGTAYSSRGVDMQWREVVDDSSMVALWSPEFEWVDIMDLRNRETSCVNTKGERFMRQKIKDLEPSHDRRYLQEAIDENNIRRSADNEIATKRQAVLDFLRPKMAGAGEDAWQTARLEIFKVSAPFLQGDYMERLFELKGLWSVASDENPRQHRMEFAAGGMLTVDGTAAGRWIWIDLKKRRYLSFDYADKIGTRTSALAERDGDRMRLISVRGHRLISATRMADTIPDKAPPPTPIAAGKSAAPAGSSSPIPPPVEMPWTRPSWLPKDAIPFMGRWFWAVERRITWQQSRDAVKPFSRLAEVPDHSTWRIVRGLAAGRMMWLGGSDAAREGKWHWESGAPFNFTAWEFRQPDNFGGRENCLHTWKNGWNDAENDGRSNGMNLVGYIAECLDDTVDRSARPALYSRLPHRPPNVPRNAKYVAGSWFAVEMGEWTWSEAKDRCQAAGGTLARIKTAEAWQALEPTIRGGHIWLGATDEKSPGQWRWLGDEGALTAGFTHWEAGEPNNVGGKEHYLSTLATGSWNDAPPANTCSGPDALRGYLCEWPIDPNAPAR